LRVGGEQTGGSLPDSRKREGKEKERVEQMNWKGVSKWKLDTPCLVTEIWRVDMRGKGM
jgi:hypothetical protein